MTGTRKHSPLPRVIVVHPGSVGYPLRRLVAEDRGVTLTEVLVSVFLMSLLMGILGTAFYQFFTATTRGNDALTVLHDLENARVWLSRDASEAQSFTTGSGSVYGTFGCGAYSTVQYRYSYNSGNTALVRERIVGGAVESTLVVARHIAQQSDVGFSVSGHLVTITLISTSGATSRGATLKINMRTD